jgi:hypothetical protein
MEQRVFEVENSEGVTVRVIAINEVQAAAYVSEGFKEITDQVILEEAKKK